MKISVEISKYPLNEDFRPIIKDFIKRLNTYENLSIITNTMSTQVFGEYENVFNALKNEIKTSFENDIAQVLVIKFINSDLRS